MYIFDMRKRVFLMEYIKSEEANEDLLFREEVMRQFEYFYQYMHGDRKEPNEVETTYLGSKVNMNQQAMKRCELICLME